MEHICHFPCSFCGVTFDCMSQCIHTGRSSQSFRHRGHHFRINNCDDRHIMWINTHEFTFLFYICDNVVDSNLCCGTCCCRNCDDRYTRILCRRGTFQASYIFKLRVCDDDTDCFCSIHRGTTTDCNDIICTGILECSHTILYILDSWVRFDVRINFVLQTFFCKNICYFACHIKFNQVRVRTYKSFFECMSLCLICNLSNCACSMIRSSI